MRSQRRMGSGGNFCKLKVKDKTTFYSHTEARVMLASSSKRPEERELLVDSRASMPMLSKKVSSSSELETLQKSRNPTTVITANEEVQTSEEAQENVHDLELFVTMQILVDTPAFLSLGKLCEEHEYTNECASGQMPQLTKSGKIVLCSKKCFVPVVVPGLSSSSSASSSSTTPRRVQQVYEVTKPMLKHRDTNAILQKSQAKKKEGQRSSNEKSVARFPRVETISKMQNCQHSHTLLKVLIPNESDNQEA